jgi:hypothetical protein
VFLDLCVTLYHATCFPIYRIAKVRRADHIAFERHLAYLNAFERCHCTYWAYANGMLSYVCEIAARTGGISAPSSRIFASHFRYEGFLAYGEAADYHAKLEEFHIALRDG